MYNEDISDYIEDALEDMKTSGVPPDILKKDTDDPRVLTAVTLYVMTAQILECIWICTEKKFFA